MSIVTLKRASKRFQYKITRNSTFSLNGGHRNQGWVGQTSLSRHNIRTPHRGTHPIGHGGCCGKYNVSVLKGSCCANDASIVKLSTKNTHPYLLSSVKHPTAVGQYSCRKGCPVINNWVKNTSPEKNSQALYIKDRKHEVSLSCYCEHKDKDPPPACKGSCVNKSIVKNKHITAVSYDIYNSSNLMIKKRLPTPPCLTHFPMLIPGNNCKKNYSTPEEAIKAGVLPDNWNNC